MVNSTSAPHYLFKVLAAGRPALLLAAAALLLGARASHAQDVSRYTFAASSGTFTPITGGTAPLDLYNASQTLAKNDGISVAIPLPFSFVYGGVARTSFQATTDGYLDFSGAGTFSQSNNADASMVGKSTVAPFYDDLNGISGAATYVVTGTAPNRVLTFEWLNWGLYTGSSASTSVSLSFQVKLYETTNVIQFVYRPETGALGATASARIGIQGASAAVGGRGNFMSLTDATAAPVLVNNAATGAVEFNNISARPAAGQVYTFTPSTTTAARPALSAGSVEIFPNPAQRAFTLRLPAMAAERTAQLTLLNSLGQSVQTRSLNLAAAGTQTQVDVSSLAPGLYTLRVQAGSQMASQQVAVQ